MRPAAAAARPSFFECMLSPQLPSLALIVPNTEICNELFSEDFGPTSAQCGVFSHVRAYVSWIFPLCNVALPVRNTDIPWKYASTRTSQRRSTGYHQGRQTGT